MRDLTLTKSMTAISFALTTILIYYLEIVSYDDFFLGDITTSLVAALIAWLVSFLIFLIPSVITGRILKRILKNYKVIVLVYYKS